MTALAQAKSAHTPGPWEATDQGDVVMGDDRTTIIAWCGDADDNPDMDVSTTMLANARLIAAAPDLLRELRGALCPGGGYSGQPRDEYADVQNCLKAGVCGCSLGAAVQKAEGSSQ